MNSELFYIFDLGEGLAGPISRVFSPLVARIIAQLISFVVNSALWTGFAMLIATAIKFVL